MANTDKVLSAKRYTPESILALATKLIPQYERATYNDPVARFSFTLWSEIRDAGGEWDKLGDWHKIAVNEALFDADPEDTENDA
jgi:hypothetical protein